MPISFGPLRSVVSSLANISSAPVADAVPEYGPQWQEAADNAYKLVSSSPKVKTPTYVPADAITSAGSLAGSNATNALVGNANIIPSYQDVLNQIQSNSQANSALSQQYAREAMQFSKEEAQKNRDWQEYMSNTSIQRQVKDLLAAGLNPVLAANGGASTPSGAVAQSSQGNVDTSTNSVLGSFLSSLISSATAINTANVNAMTQRAVADMYTAMDYRIHNDFPSTFAGLINAIAQDSGIRQTVGNGLSFLNNGVNTAQNLSIKGFKAVKNSVVQRLLHSFK